MFKDSGSDKVLFWRDTVQMFGLDLRDTRGKKKENDIKPLESIRPNII
jgi:hypothetical protein